MISATERYNFTVRVTGVLIEEDKILLVKQKVNDKRNWSLPGGKAERGETLEQALIREMKEETGLDVEINKLLYICDVAATDNALLHISFLLNRISGQIDLPSNEFESNPINDVRFVAINDLHDYGFTQQFVDIIKTNFPDAGNYVGDKKNIYL